MPAILYPIPAAALRLRQIEQLLPEFVPGNLARRNLCYSWAAFTWFGRAVHCNIGRPALLGCLALRLSYGRLAREVSFRAIKPAISSRAAPAAKPESAAPSTRGPPKASPAKTSGAGSRNTRQRSGCTRSGRL